MLKCCEFDSSSAMRSVFAIDVLVPFRAALPDADSKAGRVDACLAHLLNKRLSDGRHVLPLFLFALRDRYEEGDALHDELDALIGEVRVALGTPAVAVQHYVNVPSLPEPHFVRPYLLQENFTGRLAERQLLTDWLMANEHPLLALVAIGGMGKSSLTWYWLQKDADRTLLQGILWWSFSESESSLSSFLNEAVVYSSNHGIDPGNLPSDYDKVGVLINLLRQRRILLVLDGFERQLRAYASPGAIYQGDSVIDETSPARACIDPNASRLLQEIAAGTTRSQVLITTRLMISDLEDREGNALAGCRKQVLDSLAPDDALKFMHDQGVTKGSRAEIIAACEAYGYHPLSLRLLSGKIARDKRAPGDIAVAPRYDIHPDLIVRRHHVLEESYDALSKDLRTLLSRMAAFRNPVSYDALAVLNEFGSEAEFDDALDELLVRGLVFFDKKGNCYDLHPIVRAYAYDRLIDKTATHSRLRDYFAAIPKLAPSLSAEELGPVIELYHHCIGAERYEEALNILRSRLNDPLYVVGGKYLLFLELTKALFPADKGDGLPALAHNHDQAWVLNKLGQCYERTGQSSLAVSTFRQHIAVREAMPYFPGVALGLGNLAEVLIKMGRFQEASEILERKISLCVQIGDKRKEMIGRQDYGLLLAYQGEPERAGEQLKTTQNWFHASGDSRNEGVTWAYYTVLYLLQGQHQAALDSAVKARNLARSEQRERDIVRAEWLLGWAHCALGQAPMVEQYLTEALARCHRINLLEFEPDILLTWARLHQAGGDTRRAQESAEKAISIAERCEYGPKLADANNLLSQCNLDMGDHTAARYHAETARKQASCDGFSHCYRAAVDNAERLLEEIAARERQ